MLTPHKRLVIKLFYFTDTSQKAQVAMVLQKASFFLSYFYLFIFHIIIFSRTLLNNTLKEWRGERTQTITPNYTVIYAKANGRPIFLPTIIYMHPLN